MLFFRQFQGTSVLKKPEKSKRQEVKGARVSKKNKVNQLNFAVDPISNFNKVPLTFQQAKHNTALLFSINQLEHWKRFIPAFRFFCFGVCIWSFLKDNPQRIGQKKRQKIWKKIIDLTDFLKRSI